MRFLLFFEFYLNFYILLSKGIRCLFGIRVTFSCSFCLCCVHMESNKCEKGDLINIRRAETVQNTEEETGRRIRSRDNITKHNKK